MADLKKSKDRPGGFDHITNKGKPLEIPIGKVEEYISGLETVDIGKPIQIDKDTRMVREGMANTSVTIRTKSGRAELWNSESQKEAQDLRRAVARITREREDAKSL
jgi:hypothetical protein